MSNPAAPLASDETFLSLPSTERRLYIQKTWVGQMESGGNNHGPLPEKCLASVGLEAGEPWCAAAQYLASIEAGMDTGLLPQARNAAAVYGWFQWATENGHLMASPRRGCLFFWLHTKEAWSAGHMGSVADIYPGGTLRTFEGNTGSGSAGDQRDGDGFWERGPANDPRTLDLLSEFAVHGFIDLSNIDPK